MVFSQMTSLTRSRSFAPWLLAALLLPTFLLGACRGSEKREPPIHLNWNMDQQQRFDAQEPAGIVSQPAIFDALENQVDGLEPKEGPTAVEAIFTDGRSARLYVEGTVKADHPTKAENPCTLEFENEHLCAGKVDGEFAAALPMAVSMALLERGKDRFEIYCTPCHDAAGTGNGRIKETGRWPKNWPPPPSFHDDRLRKMPVGQIYDIVRNGVRNMPAYGPQVPVNDRWAIAAYVRTLQNSYNADLAQVPGDVKTAKGWE